MAPKKGKKEKNKKEKTPTSDPEETAEPEIPVVLNPITVTVISLNNLKESIKPTSEITLSVEFQGLVVASSEAYKVNEECEDIIVNIPISLPMTALNANYWQTLCKDSVIFTFSVKDAKPPSAPLSTASSKVGSKKGSKASVKKSSLQKASVKGSASAVLFGKCTLDLLPLVLNAPLEERIIIEQAEHVLGQNIITFKNLPCVTVTAQTQDNLEINEGSNIFFMTLEALYNAPKSMTESMSYQAMTVVPGLPVEGPILFSHGIKTAEPVLFKQKRSSGLVEQPGRVGLSKYHLNDDISDIKNEKQWDLDTLYGQGPRVEWNILHRHYLAETSREAVIRHISQDLWPVELLFSSGGSGSPSKGKKTSKASTGTFMHGMAFLNLRALAYPGETKCRVATPVYMYDIEQMKANCKVDKELFLTASSKKKSSVSSVSSKSSVKSKSAKSSTSTKSAKSAKGGKAEKKDKTKKGAIKFNEIEVAPLDPLVEIVNEENEPLFLVALMELYRPFNPARTLQDLEMEIDDIIPIRDLPPKVLLDAQRAENDFRNAIRKTVDVILNEYAEYCRTQIDSFENKNLLMSEMTTQTIDQLKLTGSYQNIKQILIDNVSALVNHKFIVGKHIANDADYQELVSDIYTYVSREAHSIVNTELSVERTLTPPGSNAMNIITSEQMWSFAMEAEELGYTDRAQRILLERISLDKVDPDRWIDYGIFLFGQGDPDKAFEAVGEGLKHNNRHRLGMLLYALLLARKGENTSCESFLVALTTLYPHFTEAWVTLHLYYVMTSQFIGSDATITSGYECRASGLAMSLPLPMADRDYVSWSWDSSETDGIFLPTAVLLLKLNSFVFTEVALAQHLIVHGPDDRYLYLLAAHHYKQGRYTDAISHLTKAEITRGQDYQLSSLLGHCYYNLEDTTKSTELYEHVLESYNRPDKIHLVSLRLGHVYLQMEDYERAKRVYLEACKHLPTPCAWYGVGIAAYKLRNLTTCEKALKEANFMDRQLSEVWGYLALVNLSLNRETEFLQCYRQAKKTNLSDENIWMEIDKLRRAYNYADPEPL